MHEQESTKRGRARESDRERNRTTDRETESDRENNTEGLEYACVYGKGGLTQGWQTKPIGNWGVPTLLATRAPITQTHILYM